MNSEFYDALCRITGREYVKVNEPMKLHTTFRIGGGADYFAEPAKAEEIVQMIQCANTFGIPCYIVGNGSNLLVSDEGYRGLILHLGDRFSRIERIGENILKAQAGASLSKLASMAADFGLAGLSFAAGIPGTVGGALTMNAGAHGGELKDVLVSATILQRDGTICTMDGQALQLGYRSSIIEYRAYIVLDITIQLEAGDTEEIRALMKQYASERMIKQPIGVPSAGSAFKRPEGYFAGKLIEDAGCKGKRVGGAVVSEKHAGFIINDGNATAQDVKQLLSEVRMAVHEQFQIELDTEIKII